LPRHIARRLVALAGIAALVVLGTVALAGGTLIPGGLWTDIARGVVAAACLCSLVWVVFYTTDIQTPLPPERPKPLPPTNDEIALAYCNIVGTYDRQALKLFVNMMIDRPHYLERINEFVSLEDEVPRLQVATRQIFRVRESARSSGSGTPRLTLPGNDQVLLVPIALLEKGTLLDGFTVTDGAGDELPTLSYNQTRGLLAYVVHAIVDISPSDHEYVNRDQGIKQRVVASLITAICSPTPMKKKDTQRRATIRRLLDSADDLLATEDQKQRVKAFCETFVDHYMIVAEVPVPVGAHVVITYRQDISIDSSSLSFVNRLRSRIGLRYSTFDIPLNIFSLDVEAYHLEMYAGPMQYVFDQHLERLNTNVRVTQEDLRRGDSEPYVRLHYNSGGPAMHLYIRRQSRQRPPRPGQPPASPQQDTDKPRPTERLKSVVEFREIPPGTLGASTVISLLTSIIIGFFALTLIGQQAPGHAHLAGGSDVPALVIALPGLASLVIGSWLDLSHLRRASLTTYLSLAASIMLSLFASLLYLVGVNKQLPGRLSLTVIGSFAIKTDIVWLVLAGCAVTCSLLVLRDVVGGSRYYFNQVKERVRRHA
jgi:hypothetical protein